jgi:hypothetical protein
MMFVKTVNLATLRGLGRTLVGSDPVCELYRDGEHYVVVLYGPPPADDGGTRSRLAVRLNREQVRAVAIMLTESAE